MLVNSAGDVVNTNTEVVVMAMVYLLMQTEILGTGEQNVRYHSHVVSAYTDLETAHLDLEIFARDAFEFNQQAAEGAHIIMTFPGDSTVYTLLGRRFSLEECPLNKEEKIQPKFNCFLRQFCKEFSKFYLDFNWKNLRKKFLKRVDKKRESKYITDTALLVNDLKVKTGQ